MKESKNAEPIERPKRRPDLMHNVPWHGLCREDSGESVITCCEYEVEGYGDVYVDGEGEGG